MLYVGWCPVRIPVATSTNAAVLVDHVFQGSGSNMHIIIPLASMLGVLSPFLVKLKHITNIAFRRANLAYSLSPNNPLHPPPIPS